MGQITIYLDDVTEKRLKSMAKNTSVSKCVAALIAKHAQEEWPDEVRELAGIWKDDFPTHRKIRARTGRDSKRETL